MRPSLDYTHESMFSLHLGASDSANHRTKSLSCTSLSKELSASTIPQSKSKARTKYRIQQSWCRATMSLVTIVSFSISTRRWSFAHSCLYATPVNTLCSQSVKIARLWSSGPCVSAMRTLKSCVNYIRTPVISSSSAAWRSEVSLLIAWKSRSMRPRLATKSWLRTYTKQTYHLERYNKRIIRGF